MIKQQQQQQQQQQQFNKKRTHVLFFCWSCFWESESGIGLTLTSESGLSGRFTPGAPSQPTDRHLFIEICDVHPGKLTQWEIHNLKM